MGRGSEISGRDGGSRKLGSVNRVAAGAALLMLALGVASACGEDTGPSATGASPIDADASPRVVVAEFLAALARDDDAARALATPLFVERADGSVAGWFDNVEDITDVQIGRTRLHDPDAGLLGSAQRHAEVRLVSASYTLDQKVEASQYDGPTITSFVLVRDDASEPWRIDDAGL